MQKLTKPSQGSISSLTYTFTVLSSFPPKHQLHHHRPTTNDGDLIYGPSFLECLKDAESQLSPNSTSSDLLHSVNTLNNFKVVRTRFTFLSHSCYHPTKESQVLPLPAVPCHRCALTFHEFRHSSVWLVCSRGSSSQFHAWWTLCTHLSVLSRNLLQSTSHRQL